MDCDQFILQSLDLPAQWIAAIGASAAGIFAYRAWREQEKQVATQEKQLRLAESEHLATTTAAARAQELERRANSPLFRTCEINASRNVSMGLQGGEVSAFSVIPNGNLTARETGELHRLEAESSTIALCVENVRHQIQLLNIAAISATPLDGAFRVLAMHQVGFIDGISQPKNTFLIIYLAKKEIIEQRTPVLFNVVFETADGYLDTHTYRTKAGSHHLERISPPSFESVRIAGENAAQEQT